MNYRFRINERLSGYREWIESRDNRRFGLFLLVVLLIGLTAIVLSNYLPSRYNLRVGEKAPETIVAPRTVIFENKQATEELRRQVADLVPPVCRTNPTALASVVGEVEALFTEAERIKADLAPSTTVTDAAGTISSSQPQFNLGLAKARLRDQAPATISDDTLAFILEAGPGTLARLKGEIDNALRVVYGGRVTEADIGGQKAVLRDLADSLDLSPQMRDAVYQISSAYLRPNQVYDDEQTRARRDEAMQDVAPVTVTVLKGERVVRAGDAVTPQTLLALQALGLAGRPLSRQIWAGVFIVVTLELLVLGGLLTRTNRKVLEDNIVLLALATLILLFNGLTRVLVIPPLSPYVVPMAALAMTTSIITKPRTALLVVSLQSLNVGLMTGFDYGFVLVAVLTAIFSLYPVSHLAQRSELLLAGVLVSLVAGAAVFASELLREAAVVSALQTSLWGLVNGMLSMVLTVSLLMIYEPVFNLTTPLRLLELANPAQPLLRRLMQVAPGTYNHSILMGNLAEAAAEAIDADPLLARVGAYYHDIGKTLRPEYFIENQLHVNNPHDKLNPNLSRLAITAHVRDGADLGRMYGLPRPVIDIIRQHHGTSVLSYFYHKAKETTKEQVTEEDYRYEGEKPTSPEAAIIMLADSVEAAAKAMKNPTVKKMQGLIREIFKQKVEDGQLDRSGLTLGDLHTIQEVFENALRGLAGHRIAYPKENGRAEGRPARVGSRGTEGSNGARGTEGSNGARGAQSTRRPVPAGGRSAAGVPGGETVATPVAGSGGSPVAGSGGSPADVSGGGAAAEGPGQPPEEGG